jgi:hypothetical protein
MVIVGTHCSTMALDRISATITYAMWHEERLWNVSVLQRVHISSLVKYYLDEIRHLKC